MRVQWPLPLPNSPEGVSGAARLSSRPVDGRRARPVRCRDVEGPFPEGEAVGTVQPFEVGAAEFGAAVAVRIPQQGDLAGVRLRQEDIAIRRDAKPAGMG